MTTPLRSVFGVCQASHFVNRFEVLYPHQFIVKDCEDVSMPLTGCRRFVNMPETRRLGGQPNLRKTTHE